MSDKAVYLSVGFKFILSNRLSNSLRGLDFLLFLEFINIFILFYNFIELITLLYIFLVIYFAQYKESSYLVVFIIFYYFSP